MLPPSLPFHRLHGNAREDTPWHCLYLDTESSWRSEQRDEVHTLRYWCAQHHRRHTGKGWPDDQGDDFGTTVEGICEYIERVSTTKHPLWTFTHNLSFDLGLTKLPLVLMQRGWRLGRHALDSDAPWCNLQLGKRSVWVCDSFSWLRKPLAEVGRLLGLAKPDLPHQDDSDEAWYGRCRADVEIMAGAMDQLMDWWDQGRLGHWSFTGPQCGWNAMRHMCVRSDNDAYRLSRDRLTDGVIDLQTGKVTICTDPGVLAFERSALYQGARDCSYVGQLHDGAWANLDIRQAHLQVAATKMLPCRLTDWGDSLPVDSPKIGGRFHGVIARVRVRSDEVAYPVRAGDHVLHPTGDYWTVLCDPEIADARARGALVEVGQWQGYTLNPFMQPWASWCRQLLDDTTGDTPPAVQIAAKAWSRTVIGKWASRTSRRVEIGTTEDWGWQSAPALHSAPAGTPGYLQLGHQVFDTYRDIESDNAFPAILAWVQSWVRLQLREVIEAAGADHVVQWNTDGLVLDAQAAGMAPGGWDEGGEPEAATWATVAAAAASIGEAAGGVALRCKGLYRAGWVLSPQHLVLDGFRVLAGIPGSAVRVDGWRFAFLTWPKLAGQLRAGLEPGYRRRWTVRDLGQVPVSRWVMTDGCCLPPRAVIAPSGGVQLVPVMGCKCEHGAVARGMQAPWLLRLSGER